MDSTKITGFVDNTESIQAENFRKVAAYDGGRCTRYPYQTRRSFNNMRTLESMAKENVLKIASETEYLYAITRTSFRFECHQSGTGRSIP